MAINYDIDEELHRRAKVAAASKGMTLKAFLEAALLAAVADAEKDTRP